MVNFFTKRQHGLSMKDQTIAFIGGGNMARSLIGGLIADGAAADKIWVSDPDESQLDGLKQRFPVHTTPDNRQAVEAADVVVLAVKPQILKGVAEALRETIQAHRPLVVSIAAGIREPAITAWLGGNVAVVRAMPNTPALVRSGATALYANQAVSESQRSLAESILRAAGLTLWLDDEAQMDAVTALSGSGPAYFFLIMEAMQAAGTALGLPPETARLLTLETAFGAAKMALESAEDASRLRERVTSPGGTTEQALKVLEEAGVRDIFQRALEAARDRSQALAAELGED